MWKTRRLRGGGERSASMSLLVRQREALHALGVNGQRPTRDLAERDPASYLRELTRTSEAAELVQRGGLGDLAGSSSAWASPAPVASGCATNARDEERLQATDHVAGLPARRLREGEPGDATQERGVRHSSSMRASGAPRQ